MNPQLGSDKEKLLTAHVGSVISKEILQSASCMLMLTTHEASSIVMLNVHPKVQSKILNISHPFASINFNIISGAVEKIAGITVLYATTGGTGPVVIVPNNVWLFPYTSDI